MGQSGTFAAPGRLALIGAVLAMTAVIAASNVLVQYPVEASIGVLSLADLLTWGAFTYPVAFLVTDLMNRSYGPGVARRVVYAGFATAVVLSIYLATPRIAIASGSAFLVGQLLDIGLFNRLRAMSWWRAPLIGSLLGSATDTLVFFSLAFAPVFAGLLGEADGFAIEPAAFLGLAGFESARWVSWAVADFSVKLFAALFLLAPYRIAMEWMRPMPAATA
ncbi:MAG: VUT family protein [Hyphomicrobiaceae bacterium]|nr:VUT family protein [Hyphomicrobiaceae bacterium]